MAGRSDGVTEGVRPTGGQLHGGSTCRGGFGKVYELEDLRNITDNFSEERLLGEGGFGKVYKGLLRNGDMIAVKKLTSTMPGIKDRQFDNEACHLMRLSHPNIVQLVGYCSHTEEVLVLHQGKYVYAEKSERLLCLEYQPKGSLHEHLSDESSGLDWDSRYKIIEGICNGLHYLHEKWQASTPIIHMDLKPKNILLDDNMVPKIADFGLSRLFGEEQTRTCTASRDGTLGYMAPEYLNRGIITKKLDIFSLGVIIIEIMTGHKDYPDETDTSSQEFIELVLKNWRNRLEKTPRYTTAFSIFPSFCLEIDYQRIRRCIQIGLACVKLNRVKRPTTLEILNMLHKSEGAECSNGKEDYTNERLEEVNGPLYNKAEDRLNGTHNCGFSKGKKRERDERGIDPAKLHRDSLHNIDDSEPGSFKLDDMESKIAKITEKGGLANAEAVEELLRLMELDQTEQRIDLSGRVILADVIAATEKPDILHIFMESKGLLVLDSWLQEAHKGKSGDDSSPKEADKLREELLLAVLRALARLPINLSALTRCSIGKSVNHLRSHKNLEIKKKSKLLVEDWKKRVNAEMKPAMRRMHAQDYTNERLEEVNGPLYNKAEDRLNGTQNCGFSKGKKRERDERGIDPAKLHRDSLHNIDDSEPGSFKLDHMESKIAKITEKGGLANAEAVEELLRLMELDQTEQRIDLSGRVILADVIAATEKPDILRVFMESRGLLVLDSWLQEAHKWSSGDGSSPKEADKPIGAGEFILAVLRALARLPINCSALQRCSIGKNVNRLRSYENVEIRKKSRLVVENWVKRVDAEMKAPDARPSPPKQLLEMKAPDRRVDAEMKAPVARPSPPKQLLEMKAPDRHGRLIVRFPKSS